MNYYEELGIPETASVREIRQAYKRLARLLHPDSQADPVLKTMAESQMKRLNEMLETLVDPRNRIAYDDSLLRPGRPSADSDATWLARVQPVAKLPRPPTFEGLVLRHWFWLLLGVLVAGIGVWALNTRAPDPAVQDVQARLPASRAVPQGPRAARKAASGPQTEDPPAQPKANRHSEEERRPARTPFEPGAAHRPPDPVRLIPEPPATLAPTASAQMPLPASGPNRVEDPINASARATVREPVAAPAAAANGPQAFAGSWLYSPQGIERADPGTFPATYVELDLRHSDGLLVGNYRAHYKVADRALSPEVTFRLEGKLPDGGSATLEWASADGGKGQAELVLRSPGLMRLNWWTTRFGSRAGVSSGTAMLIRQQAP